MRYQAFGATDVGCVRSSNQDVFLIDEQLGVYAVADGMGGHKHGEMAADLACKTLSSYLQCSRDRSDVSWPFGYDFDLSLEGNLLTTAVQLANRQVWRIAEQQSEYAGMGTTMAAVLTGDGTAAVANVGDSRVYCFRDGALTQVTVDDTWVAEMSRRGGVDPAQLQKNPMRNVLTQAAGSRETLKIHLSELELRDGDQLMLTSDGLHGVVGDSDMRAILASGERPERIPARMIEEARYRGGPDNIACVLLACAA